MKNIHIAIRVSFFLLPAFIVCSLIYFFDLSSISSIPSQKDGNVVENDNLNRKSLKKVLKSQKISNTYGFSDWCQLNYEDLSKDPIFDQFEYWIKQYDSLQVEGDQREFLSNGRELAKKRSKVLQKIIRGDPQTALKLAIQSRQIEKFPPSVKEHLEKWRSDTADIESTHVCFDPKHPGGYINRHAILENGTRLRAWVFGKRRNLPSIKSLSVWGISIGDDFAISDEAIQNLTSIDNKSFLLGGQEVSYNSTEEFELFKLEVKNAEKQAFLHQIPVRYPRIASSSGLTDYYERKYDLFPTPTAWSEAKKAAEDRNGTLVIIGSQAENNFIRRLLDPDQIDYFGVNETGQQIQMVWIGATDNEDTNSTVYDLDSNTSSIIDLNASEGNWKWLDGIDVGSGPFQNWANGEPNSPAIPTQDYAALDWSTDGGTWKDVNGTYLLPFVIEYTLAGESAASNIPINGHRKVLVVPSRFRDEVYDYGTSGPPLVDELGQPIFDEMQLDSYEPVTQDLLAIRMEEVREFFLRNSDESFDLQAVITPAVTIPHDKYGTTLPNGEANLYDTSGQYIGFSEVSYPSGTEMDFAADAVALIALEDEAWNIDGPAFTGVLEIQVANTDPSVVFSTPPVIDLIGGGNDPDDQNRVRQRFQKAKVEAVTNGLGQIVGIKILDAGAYYFSSPEILVNGETVVGYDFQVTIGSTLVSWGTVNTYSQGAAGMGFVGAQGFWAIASGGDTSATTITHELGHNFGLLHANRMETRSEKPNSDESAQFDYGNPYSVMGSASIYRAGDFTIAEKVISRSLGHYGLDEGNQTGVDVLRLLSSESINNSELKDGGEGLPENTFRIYRHDYKSAPLPLRASEFSVFIPEDVVQGTVLSVGEVYPVDFNGSGEGALGELRLDSLSVNDTQPNATLWITSSGIGYVSEPRVLVYQVPDLITGDSELILSLDAEWIKEPTGTDSNTGTYSYYSQSELRDHSDFAKRGIRGLRLKASEYSPPGMDSGDPLNCFWLSYRRNASELGISVLNGNTDNAENFLIDMTLNTPQDFSDAFLYLGQTFSDYDSDVHFTPIAKGGIPPMEYLQVVVNMGTTESGQSEAPQFSLHVSNNQPKVGEFVNITAQVNDNNESNYAYTWFINENFQTDSTVLNKPTILKAFSTPGEVVVRVVVSDFKGGISSRNLVLKVGEYENSNLSSLSGTVRNAKGNLEGARISLSPAPIINHTVSVVGNAADSFLPSGKNDPLTYLVDGLRSPTLNFRRGEIHRFQFEVTTQDHLMHFLDNPEYELPRLRMNMLVTPKVHKSGAGYPFTPVVEVSETSTFSTYFSNFKGPNKVGDIFQLQQGYLDPSSTELLHITRPFAKSLLVDTIVDSVSVSPVSKDIDGNYEQYGGKGHNRDNPPNVFIYRSSFWEDYQENNASAKAYVDGVGTISPVRSENFYDPIWETRSKSDPIPELVVWGSGGSSARPYVPFEGNETNASVIVFEDSTQPNAALRSIEIPNQGQYFEPDSTMAVLHYPLDPLAYWTFDRHESLFEDSAAGRYQPTPAWNALQEGTSDIFPNDSKLSAYWAFDDENGTLITAYPGFGSDKTMSFSMTDANRSQWGVKGRAVYLNGTDSFSTSSNQVSTSGTLSMWLKPEGNFTFDLGPTILAYDHAALTCTFGITDDNVSITRNSSGYEWMHVAIVGGESNSTLYVDGMSISTSLRTLGSVDTDDFVGLLDEIHFFNTALTSTQIKILAGKIFLDLSGNKVHAAPVGPDFPMIDPDTDAGLSSIRPSIPNHPFNPQADSPVSYGSALGDSYGGEGHGRSIYFDDNDSYLDISPHAFFFAPEDQGSISFWVRTDGRDDNGDPTDQNLFTAACLEDNASFFRIMIRDTGVMQLHAMNDGTEVAKFYTDSSAKVVTAPTAWHHVVFVAKGEKSEFWVDGKLAASKTYASAEGENSSGDKRAFFSDIENLDFVAIGAPFFNTENNNTESFRGHIDDFYIYNRDLSASEINYLYDLRMGREQIPRLEAMVDAVGTVKILDNGDGYKETPDVFFTYGLDGNETSEFDDQVDDYADLATDFPNPVDGQLVYVRNEGLVYSWHHVRDESDWRHDNNNGWVEYRLAYGVPNLNTEEPRGSVDQYLWTREMENLVAVDLPDGRSVFRRYLEYVVLGDGLYPAPSGNYGAPHGLFGYSSNPTLSVEQSPKSLKDSANGYVLFFADQNHSGEIVNSGMGLTQNAFSGNTSVRISGKGYQPDKWRYDSSTYNLNPIRVRSQYSEYWGIFNPKGVDGIFDPYGGDEPFFTSDPSLRNEYPTKWSTVGNFTNSFDGLRYDLPNDEDPIAVFEDWDRQPDTGEPRDVGLEFNQTLAHITLEHTGIGYSMPVEVSLIGGYPQIKDLAEWVANANPLPYPFTPAQFVVGAVDQDGAILNFTKIDGGQGYNPDRPPTVVITGGGGSGASAKATVADDGTIDTVEIENGGRGYFNINPSNQPTAQLVIDPMDPLIGLEQDANLSVRLGGFLNGIPRCNRCGDGHHANTSRSQTDKFYYHRDPWIEIWDRNRSEITIDEMGDRALATAKVRNGKIEKVIVLKSGRGYIDPVAYVRAGPPHIATRYDDNDHFNRYINLRGDDFWKASILHDKYPPIKSETDGVYRGIPHDDVELLWRCTNLRENKVGKLEECGHIHAGQYPPENCPGEVTDEFPVEAEETESAVSEWQTKHWNNLWAGQSKDPHRFCGLNRRSTNSYYRQEFIDLCTDSDLNNSKHLDANFRSRRCTGTIQNFVLLNDLYRAPYKNWQAINAKLDVITEGGKIKEIVVIDQGEMYAASEVKAKGTGGDVDAIPVFNERGENIRVIYDDPDLKNLELTYQVSIDDFQDLQNKEFDYRLFLPKGAGQGFMERPWSWDWIGSNDPTFGPREKVTSNTTGPEDVNGSAFYHEKTAGWSFGAPSLADYLGDRVRQVNIVDGGIFDDGRVIDQISFNFDSSHVQDADGNGSKDFISAVASPYFGFHLTKFQLDQNATFISSGYSDNLYNGQNRSLFLEEPTVNILPHLDASGVLDDTAVSFMRLNGVIGYDNDKNRSYVDIYVDDSMPANFHYGFGVDADGLPAMGGEIIVTDGLPVMSWGQNDPEVRSYSAYTDAQGSYFLSSLSPGFYNVGVFLEDRKFQDLTFRPDSNLTRVSDYVYIPGFSEDLRLETDARGAGVSRLVWSAQARKLSRPDPNNLGFQTETEYEQKILEGIGRGFDPLGAKPELIVIPDTTNSNNVYPKIEVTILSDGSLKLEIIDDVNTTAYNPSDRFTVSYSSSVQGIDFKEFFQFSESGSSDWGGYLDAESGVGARLEISPNDANGTSFVELPLTTSYTGPNPFEFKARAYDQNGLELDTSGVEWNISLSFQPPEGNQSLVADLGNSIGSSTNMTITSTLRRTGVVDFEVRSPGNGYQNGEEVQINGTGDGFAGNLTVNQDGNITGVQITDPGTGYSNNEQVSIIGSTGNSGLITAVLGGSLYLDANLTIPGGEVLYARTLVHASTRNSLTEDEKWLDRHFDSIQERNSTWWESDLDNDNLSNFEEKVYGTHPLSDDTDGDQLTDDLEITYQTNPHQPDTDADGLTDYNETVGDPFAVNGSTGTDPRKFDTDKDGMSDGFEVIYGSEISELDPTIQNTLGKNLGGYVFNLDEYVGQLYIKVKKVNEGDPCEVEEEFNLPWQALDATTFPYLYTFENLPTGYIYQVSVFIDTYPVGSPNGSYDKGEPSACWQGTLTTNTFSANLFLQEDPPDIYFANPSHNQITLPDPATGTFSFALTVTAWDLLDGEWDLNSSSPEINVISNGLGSYLTLDKPNLLATVDNTTPLGSYEITYRATDSSGSNSKTLSQSIIIDDSQGPELVLLGENPYPYPYGSAWVDPGWLVSDNRDDETNIVVLTMGTPDTGSIGTFIIEYQALDSAGNKSTQTREVQIVDTIAPSITASETIITISQGQDFSLPEYSAADNVDGDVSDSIVISGVEQVDTNKPGDYEIIFSVSDSTGNSSQLSLIVRVEPPAFSLRGNAIDGYLIGAKVILDTNGDGVNDLSAVAYTQENGEYTLGISQEEFLMIDADSNGIIDPSEGRILVNGGVDSTTGETFYGTLMADANASVVTPITSLVVGLIDQGIDKEAATEMIASKLGLSGGVDLTTFDPLENAANGNSTSAEILIEGARIASIMKQTEAFVSLLEGDDYVPGSASLAITAMLADKIHASPNDSVNPLDNQTAEIITQVITNEVSNELFTSDEVADFAQIIQATDSLHQTLKATNMNPIEVATEVAKQQLAVKQEVLDALEEISDGAGSIESVSSSISVDSLLSSTDNFLEVNLFAPDANDFTFVLSQDELTNGQELLSLDAVDLDGDQISYTILSQGIDTDGDGVDFLQIDPNGKLLIQDAGEISNIMGQKFDLSISLSDSRGKIKTISGSIMVDNPLVMESQTTDVSSWMNSAWFGNFHKTGGPWIYHEKLGWQYVYTLSSGGFWFWDKDEKNWWWTTNQYFPYAYDYGSSSWVFYSLDSDVIRVYDFNQQTWRSR